MRPLPRLSPTAALLLAAPGVIVITWGVLFGAGGLAPGASSLIAAGTTIPASIVLGLIALRRWPYRQPEPLMLAAGGGMAVFALIAAASATWSLSPAKSAADAILVAAYVGAFSLGALLAPAVRQPGTVIATGLTGIATLAAGWALFARSFAATANVQFSPRLAGTLTLPNALAILVLAGLFGSLALCANRVPRLRAIGGAMAAINTMALILTSSRSGLGLAVIGIAVILLMLPSAPRMRYVGLAAIVPSAALGLWAATWLTFGIWAKVVPEAGARLVAISVVAAVAGCLIAYFGPALIPGAVPHGPHRKASRRTVYAAIGSIALLGAAVIARNGGPISTIDAVRLGFSETVNQGGLRFGIGANLRDHWWRTAWDGFVAAPLTGDGAGTFRLLEQTTREPAFITDSAHNTILEVLAGTGLVGIIPFLIGAGSLVILAIRALRRAPEHDAAGTTVAVLAALAFLAQGLVDINWDLAAQGAITFATIGALARASSDTAPASPAVRGIAGTAAVLLLSAGLLAVPTWLSERQTELSNQALPSDPLRALDLAVSAHRYNPLAVDPLLAEADAREALGDTTGAQSALIRAIDREPSNFEVWLYYGTYLAFSWNAPEEGRAALQRAIDLSGGDPSVLTVYESLPLP